MITKTPGNGHEYVIPPTEIDDYIPNPTAGSTKKPAGILAESRQETGAAAIGTISDVSNKEKGKSEVVRTANENVLTYTFAEAAGILKSAGFDLEEARKNAVQSQLDLVKALQAKGIVRSDDEYGALYDKATPSKKGILEIAKYLESGEKPLVIFNPRVLSFAGLWQILIHEGGIPYSPHYGFEKIDERRKIIPDGLKDLKNLHDWEFYEQNKAFEEARENAPAWEPGGPEISFTPNSLSPMNKGKSAIEYMQEIADGAQYIDPSSDLIRWITQYRDPENRQKGLIPDDMEITLYPDHVVPKGVVTGLVWSYMYKDLMIDIYHPSFKDQQLPFITVPRMGVRSVIR